MNPVESLANYLARVRHRFRLLAWTRGAAAVSAVALILTLALAPLALSPAAVRWGRVWLFLGVETAFARALLVPLLRLTPRAIARTAERRYRKFDQRLLTFLDRQGGKAPDPFLPLLAADTLAVAADAPPEKLVRTGAILGSAAALIVSGVLLAWLILQAADAQILWAAKSAFGVRIEPGLRTVSRGWDVPVAAKLLGFTAKDADVWVRSAGSAKWRRMPMRFEERDAEFHLTFAALREDAEFYVEAEGIRSAVSRIRAVDLPRVRNVTASWEGQTGEPGGDLFAPAGTMARVAIETDRPMAGGQLVFDAGDPLKLSDTKNNRTLIQFKVSRDGEYHVGMMYGGEAVPVSEDYAIVVMRRERMPDRKGRPVELPDGVRTSPAGAVPPGYERAVTEYFKRLNASKGGR